MGKDPMRSAHMNIQQKFLCIAAYEEVNVNGVKGYPMLSSHTTNKEVMK